MAPQRHVQLHRHTHEHNDGHTYNDGQNDQSHNLLQCSLRSLDGDKEHQHLTNRYTDRTWQLAGCRWLVCCISWRVCKQKQQTEHGIMSISLDIS